MKNARLEIFCGTGGVGKTTLATSRALHLANQGKKVFLMTIDPSLRLKQALCLGNPGLAPEKIGAEVFGQELKGELHAHLLSTEVSFQRLWQKKDNAALDNSLLKLLARPNGGLNEIMAMIELRSFEKANEFDHYILDTPPGEHFIHFLEAGAHIHQFFNSRLVEALQAFSDRPSILRPTKWLLQSGTAKALGVLEKLTGAGFLESLVEALKAVLSNKDAFLDALNLFDKIEDSQHTQLFLVTSMAQNKGVEALKMLGQAHTHKSAPSKLLVNYALPPEIQEWNPQSKAMSSYKQALLAREQKLRNEIEGPLIPVHYFPEISALRPQEQILQLSKLWP